ncbi:helix-turn-helix domain-containing protein [Novosphingobium sp. JCM 18896]|uniref:helix-turn-helix domain-containing protein n=1 Tax=Novosphingobium sp. JCM 18896 TaxID=2989731 RepID=UPI002221360A|nr:helix-turn-helix domain-containing protein [Novosphingobium sp. JCM 18896]MCW1431886.1 helix-turn-helix domain-containing protein [Novosphingobium sp. JCM 18896]
MEKLYVSVTEACRLIGVGRTTMYSLFDRGTVETITIGRRRLVVLKSLRALGDP